MKPSLSTLLFGILVFAGCSKKMENPIQGDFEANPKIGLQTGIDVRDKTINLRNVKDPVTAIDSSDPEIQAAKEEAKANISIFTNSIGQQGVYCAAKVAFKCEDKVKYCWLTALSDNWRCEWLGVGLFKNVALRGEFGLSDDLNRDRRRATDGSLSRAEGMDRVCGVSRGSVGWAVALAAAAVDAGGRVCGWAADGDDVVTRRDIAAWLS